MNNLHSLVATVLMVAVCSTVSAQATDLPALTPQCPPGVAPTIDSTTVTIGLWPSKKWRDATYDDAQRLRMRYYADGIRQHFVAPASLGGLPLLGEPNRRTTNDDYGYAVIEGRLALIVDPSGRVAKMAWEQMPLAAAVASAVAKAVAAADSNGAFEGIPRRAGAIDTLSLTIATWARKLPSDAVPLFKARLAGYIVESDAAVLKKVNPEYPENAERNFAENVAMVSFIVGSNGRAYMPSFQVTRTNFSDFEAPLRTAIAETLFRPSRSNGCAVPRLVEQRFEFRMKRP